MTLTCILLGLGLGCFVVPITAQRFTDAKQIVLTQIVICLAQGLVFGM